MKLLLLACLICSIILNMIEAKSLEKSVSNTIGTKMTFYT